MCVAAAPPREFAHATTVSPRGAATLALPRGAAQEGRQSVAELGRRDVRAITDAPWPPGRSMASWTRIRARAAW